MTEQKIAERELRRRERELQALFDSAMDAIIIVNDEGYYLNLNPAACELLGVGRDTFVGHHIAPLMGLLPMSEEFEQQWSALRSRRHHFGEFMIPVPEGQRIVEYQASFSFLPDRNLFFLRDITELRYLEAERIEKERIAVALRRSANYANSKTVF